MKLSALLALALLVLPAGGLAQTRASAQSSALYVSVEGPEWIGTAQSSIQEGVGSKGGPVVITEFIPEGQSFDNWQELFAIMIEEDIELSLAQYQSQQVGRYMGACDMEPHHVYSFETDPSYALFIVFCGSYKASPQAGEMAVFFMTSTGPHFIKIYRHFRGAAFDPHDTTQWPAEQAQMDQFLGSMQSIQVSNR